MSHVFISHAPDDLDAVLEVHEALRRADIATQHDQRRGAGASRSEVDAKIGEAAAVVVLLSSGALKSREVRADVDLARALGAPIIAFRIDRSRLSGPLKGDLSDRLLISKDDADGLGSLIRAVQDGYRRKCPVIAVMNLKGGVGKTTIAAQLAGVIQTGALKRVLLVDFDPQYNLTQVFFDMPDADASAAKDKSVISLFEKSRLHDADAPSPADDWTGLSTAPFAPASREAITHDLFGPDGPEGRLDLISGQFEISKYAFATDATALDAVRRNFLKAVAHYRSVYDLILFDTNPNATFLTRCALEASDRVVAPMHADPYSLRGVRLLRRVIDEQVPEAFRPDVSILFNAVDRNEQSDFEADARIGAFDGQVGFPLSKTLMAAALPRSGHMRIKPIEDGDQAWRRLLAHHGRGGGLRAMRESLAAAAQELEGLLQTAKG